MNRRRFFALLSLLGIGRMAGAAIPESPGDVQVSRVLQQNQWLLQITRRLPDGQDYAYVELMDNEPDAADIERFRRLARSVFEKRQIELFG